MANRRSVYGTIDTFRFWVDVSYSNYQIKLRSDDDYWAPETPQSFLGAEHSRKRVFFQIVGLL